jgi:hypothetical protein
MIQLAANQYLAMYLVSLYLIQSPITMVHFLSYCIADAIELEFNNLDPNAYLLDTVKYRGAVSLFPLEFHAKESKVLYTIILSFVELLWEATLGPQ